MGFWWCSRSLLEEEEEEEEGEVMDSVARITAEASRRGRSAKTSEIGRDVYGTCRCDVARSTDL